MFHFTIRDVLWLTVVVGLAIGWWVDRSRLAMKNRKLTEIDVFPAIESVVSDPRQPLGK